MQGKGNSRSDRPKSDRPKSDRPKSDRPKSDRPRSDRPKSDRPKSDRPRSDRPKSDRPKSDRPRSDRPRSAGTGSDRPRSDRQREERDGSDRTPVERGPWVPEEIQFEDLDKSVRFELHTLPETLQEKVGRHLLAAEIAVADDDLDLALAHARHAKKLAGRVAVVRESAGVIEYLAGEYAAALTEFRAVRRMTGSNEFVAMMADCERGLGRPAKALDFLKSLPMSELSKEIQIEALLVAAGARADLGQIDAALIMLDIPALTKLPAGDQRARLQEAYATLLEKAGRVAEAEKWRAKAVKSDINGVTAFVRDAEDSEVSVEWIGETD
jgi:tetratricopeptide (TPR) repeat protein